MRAVALVIEFGLGAVGHVGRAVYVDKVVALFGEVKGQLCPRAQFCDAAIWCDAWVADSQLTICFVEQALAKEIVGGLVVGVVCLRDQLFPVVCDQVSVMTGGGRTERFIWLMGVRQVVVHARHWGRRGR